MPPGIQLILFTCLQIFLPTLMNFNPNQILPNSKHIQMDRILAYFTRLLYGLLFHRISCLIFSANTFSLPALSWDLPGTIIIFITRFGRNHHFDGLTYCLMKQSSYSFYTVFYRLIPQTQHCLQIVLEPAGKG